MLKYPDFGRFIENKYVVVNFLEKMPILKRGNRSIALESEFFEIKPMTDSKLVPSGSYWNLIPYDDWDAQDAAPKHNHFFYSEIQENSTGSMWPYLEYTCGQKDLNDWIISGAMADENVQNRIKDSLFDQRDESRFEIVWADLRGILLSLILYGETNNFTGGVKGDEYKLYCKIRKAYYAGGYPYGWIGDYPDKVKLLVHFEEGSRAIHGK